tara:strand:+ start:330 stop:815 length:486 start_codon:yes stop_codon:yes gene_type:complete
MKHIIKKQWTTGSGKSIDFYEILNLIKNYTVKGSKVFIGTDSFVSNKKICFATAVCLHNKDNGGRYFFFRDHIPKKSHLHLISRITEEARRSIEVGTLLMNEYKFDASLIELHLDISPISCGNATSKFSDMLKGYVQGYGFNYRIKPDAWASQSIADKHSK